MAEPGYYPDPWAAGQLRWWDGSAWTQFVSAPVEPAAPVGPAPFVAPGPTSVHGWAPTASGPAVATMTPSYVVTGHRARPRSAGDRPAWLVPVAVLGAVVVLVMASYTWTHRRTQPVVPGADVAQAAPQGGAATAAAGPSTGAGVDDTVIDGEYAGPIHAPLTTPRGADLVTPADARSVLKAFWPQHETAVVTRNLEGLAALSTGTARADEVGSVACGCRSRTQTRSVLAAAYFVRHQSRYPVDFLVETQASDGDEASRWTDLYVFTKQGSGKPWLVALHSGYASAAGTAPALVKPSVDGAGYLPQSSDAARLTSIAARLPRATASLWQRTADTGVIPAHPGLLVRGTDQSRLEQIASHHGALPGGVRGQYRFWTSPTDPLFVYRVSDGAALACRAVRETSHLSAPAGVVMVQRTGFRPWGYPLPAGRYPRLTTATAWQTCWGVAGGQGQPAVLINTADASGTTIAG